MKKGMSRRAPVLLLSALALLLTAGCAAGSGGEPGEEKDPKDAALSFHSFDGGGPEFGARLEDESLVALRFERDYGREDHEELDGAACTVVLTLHGLKPGETRMTVEERSPIAGNFDRLYIVRVAEDLTVSTEALGVTDLDAAVEQTATLVIECGEEVFYASFADNPAAEEFRDVLSREMLALTLHDRGGFEKTGALPFALESADEPLTARPGELLLCRGDQLCLLCAEDSREGTPLAAIGDADGETLRARLGDGDVTLLLWVEWSE